MLPVPRMPITVRVATMDDLAFIDSLQKTHTHMVGWMPTKPNMRPQVASIARRNYR